MKIDCHFKNESYSENNHKEYNRSQEYFYRRHGLKKFQGLKKNIYLYPSYQ